MVATLERTALPASECWARLRTAHVGRLSYTERAMPMIHAVPFVVDGSDVVVAIGASACRPDLFDRPTIVAFEAGEWAPERRAGWSVHFVGKARRIHDQELTDLATNSLSCWIDGELALYVHITVKLLGGQHVLSIPAPR